MPSSSTGGEPDNVAALQHELSRMASKVKNLERALAIERLLVERALATRHGDDDTVREIPLDLPDAGLGPGGLLCCDSVPPPSASVRAGAPRYASPYEFEAQADMDAIYASPPTDPRTNMDAIYAPPADKSNEC